MWQLETTSKVTSTFKVLIASIADVDIASCTNLRAFISNVGCFHSVLCFLFYGETDVVIETEDERKARPISEPLVFAICLTVQEAAKFEILLCLEKHKERSFFFYTESICLC